MKNIICLLATLSLSQLTFAEPDLSVQHVYGVIYGIVAEALKQDDMAKALEAQKQFDDFFPSETAYKSRLSCVIQSKNIDKQESIAELVKVEDTCFAGSSAGLPVGSYSVSDAYLNVLDRICHVDSQTCIQIHKKRISSVKGGYDAFAGAFKDIGDSIELDGDEAFRSGQSDKAKRLLDLADYFHPEYSNTFAEKTLVASLITQTDDLIKDYLSDDVKQEPLIKKVIADQATRKELDDFNKNVCKNFNRICQLEPLALTILYNRLDEKQASFKSQVKQLQRPLSRLMVNKKIDELATVNLAVSKQGFVQACAEGIPTLLAQAKVGNKVTVSKDLQNGIQRIADGEIPSAELQASAQELLILWKNLE
jgi:hypothetical protein